MAGSWGRGGKYGGRQWEREGQMAGDCGGRQRRSQDSTRIPHFLVGASRNRGIIYEGAFQVHKFRGYTMYYSGPEWGRCKHFCCAIPWGTNGTICKLPGLRRLHFLTTNFTLKIPILFGYNVIAANGS